MKTLTSHRITRGLSRLAFAAAASTVLLTGVLSSPAGAVAALRLVHRDRSVPDRPGQRPGGDLHRHGHVLDRTAFGP